MRLPQQNPISIIFNHELVQIDRIRAELLDYEKKREVNGGEDGPQTPYIARG